MKNKILDKSRIKKLGVVKKREKDKCDESREEMEDNLSGEKGKSLKKKKQKVFQSCSCQRLWVVL